MSIETYEKFVGKFELYKLLDDGVNAMRDGKVRPFKDVLTDIEKDL